VTSTENLEESEVPAVFNLAILVAVIELDVLDASLVEGLLTRPLKGLGPCLISEPIADKVGITSIDQNWDFLEDPWHKAVERLHPVALEKEISVDIEVTAVIAADFDAKFLLDFPLIQILADIAKSRIAEIIRVFALATNIIDVLAGSLVGTNERIVAIDTCRNTGPDAFAIVAVLDQALAARESIVHSLAFAFIENSRVSALSASHGSVVFVLSQSISKTIPDQD